MKAIIQHGHGGPDVLEYAEVDTPTIKDDEVLVSVRAASVGAWDWHVMRGDPRIMGITGMLKPKNGIPGLDFAGVVEAVGDDVPNLQPGDEVYGESANAFAEFVAASRDSVAIKPTNTSFEQAASVPVAGITALMGLRDFGQVRAGQRVLIVGAAGGVGTFAVQIAVSMGAEVTGVCSPGSTELVESLGAHHIIDYTRGDLSQNGEQYDMVFQVAGDDSLSTYRTLLTPKGTLVLCSGSGGEWFGPIPRILRAVVTSPFVGQRLVTFVAKTSRQGLLDLKDLIESGDVTPIIERTYPLSEAAEAIGRVAQEHNRGKTVLVV
ncbi:MAG: NAD(P)-dependent alcohol dehydrogenase [Acidimicrobiia bacterium]